MKYYRAMYSIVGEPEMDKGRIVRYRTISGLTTYPPRLTKDEAREDVPAMARFDGWEEQEVLASEWRKIPRNTWDQW